MKIILNGTETTTQADTITALIAENGMAGKPVVVERNKEALVASAHKVTLLQEGDQIELFVLGAGG